MKKTSFLFGILAILAFAASCETQIDIQSNPVEPQAEQITITASINEALTKVAFTAGTDGSSMPIMELAWEAGDELLVADHANPESNSLFTLSSGAGEKTAVFTGTPVSASSYDVSVVHGDVTYNAQTQAADGDASGLVYIASKSDITDLSGITFDQVNSVLGIIAKMPSTEVAAKIKSVDITASDNIFNGGNALSITLSSIGDTDGDGILNLYATLPVGNQAIPAGSTLLMKFNAPGEGHDVYTRLVEIPSAVTLTAGRMNSIKVNCSQSANHAGAVTCDGSNAAKAYLIGDKYQMTYLMNLYKAAEDAGAEVLYYVKLVDDINLSGVEWIPFNRAGTYKRQINFDGQGHTISNLTVGSSYAYPSFAGVAYGTYKDFTIDSATITAGSNHAGVFAGYVGTTGIVASCSGITIKDSSVTGLATSNSRNSGGFAGIVGNAGCTITNCHVIGSTTVSQKTTDKTGCSVGGFIGNLNAAATISNCTAHANLNNDKSYYTGGFIGQIGSAVAATISNCAFLGGNLNAGRNATSNSPVAGFVGRVAGKAGATFTNCYVDGAIITATNSGRCGGFLGDSGDKDANVTTFTSCRVLNSSISGSQHCGGFAGVLYTTANKCYVDNTTLTANNTNVGGFVGYPQNATITNCYVTSSVTVTGGSYNAIGGFVGNGVGGNTITECYEAATVSGSSAGVGAFIGYVNTAETSITKNIAWNGSLSFYGDKAAIDDSTITGNYTGTSGTISSQATALGWNGSVWDLSGSVPTLK